MNFERELDLALRLVGQAGALALHYQSRGFGVETKKDLSPVTLADRQCERMIVAGIEEEFPEDGILGEEGASKAGGNGRKWIIDPIDGTRDFVRGLPTWAHFLGLEENGSIVVGAVAVPGQRDTFFAARGEGAWRNGVRLRVSEIAEPAKATLSLCGFDRLGRLPYHREILEYAAQFWSVRSYGGAFDAMMVAAGHIDAWVEPSLKPWDLAAPSIILEEAGAIFENFDGGSSIYGGTCVAANPGLMPHLRQFFQSRSLKSENS